jgi:hypothetical protein
MPFGKYRDRELNDVPEGYLLWCRDSLELEPELSAAIRQELFARSTHRVVRRFRASPAATANLKSNIAVL